MGKTRILAGLVLLLALACACSARGALSGTPPQIPLAVAWAPPPPDRTVVPKPKEREEGTGAPFRLPAQVRIRQEGPSAAPARELARQLSERFGVQAGGEDAGIRLTLDASDLPAEGYRLRIDASGIQIAAGDRAGLFHGVQTLMQLLHREDAGVLAEPVAIRDWPSLGFRGVHVLGGARADGVHRQLLERILAPLKLNAVVVETEYAQWKSHPEIWHPERSMPLSELRLLVQRARELGVEPIPLVQALSHTGWMFVADQHLEFAADPATRYAVDPTDERSWKVLLDVCEEALEIFRPRYLHIGHDEVQMRGAFPKPGTKGDMVDQVAGSVRRLRDYLKARKAGTMMWADMLLHPSEVRDTGGAPTPEDARRLREALPKDVVLVDWQYREVKPGFPELDLLRKAGFRVIGASWNEWHTIREFGRELDRAGDLGLLQTTWAGYAYTPAHVTGTEFYQFASYVVAAESAWNAGEGNLADSAFRPERWFLQQWNPPPHPAPAPRPGFALDLDPFANPKPWSWETGDSPAEALPTGQVTLEDTTFVVGDPVLVGNQALELDLEEARVGALAFLWGAAQDHAPKAPVMTLRVEYADAHSVEVPLLARQEIFALLDPSPGTEALEVWRGKGPSGRRTRLRRWIWENPRPEAPIRRLTLKTDPPDARVVLLGITGLAVAGGPRPPSPARP